MDKSDTQQIVTFDLRRGHKINEAERVDEVEEVDEIEEVDEVEVVTEEDGWRWLVLSMACVNMLVNCCVNYHAGVLNMAVLEHFRSDPIMTSWLISIYVSMFATAGQLSLCVCLTLHLSDCSSV